MTWKTIKIKEETYNLLNKLSTLTKTPKHKLIHSALTFYYEFHFNSHKREKILSNENDKIEKVSWKIYKFSKSIGHFIENPTRANYNYIRERLEEILQLFNNTNNETLNEIKLLCEKLKNLCRRYMENHDKNVLIELNQTCKLIIKLVLLHCL